MTEEVIEIVIDCDEVYPVYSAIKRNKSHDDACKRCEWYRRAYPISKIPKSKWEWIKRTEEEFYKMQEYLGDIEVKAHKKKRRLNND